jgi:hypothetical protein
LSLQGVVSLSLLFHGGVGLVHVCSHARAPAKPYDPRVYDSGGVSYLSCARRSCIPYSGGGIRHGICGVLRARIQCAVPPISLLLLQFYGLELHHLTLSRILHLVAFVTLCEAYMGIEPHIIPWNYFLHAQLWQGSHTEDTLFCILDIYV